MKPAWQLLLCTVLVGGLAAGQSAIPQAPSEDFSDVRAAVRGASSWHVVGVRPILVKGQPDGLMGIDMAAECPDQELVTMEDGKTRVRFVVLGRQAWGSTSDSADAPWEKMEVNPEGNRPPCGHDQLAGRMMRPETAWSPGITVVRGTVCRRWELQFYDENDAEIEGSLCAGPDNLPLEAGFSDGTRLIFIDWGHTDVGRLLAQTRIQDLMLRSGGPLPTAKTP
jgi:hypothetical protein